MEEQLINFETAKLAKEKGFNIFTRHFYADLSWNSKEIYKSNEVGYDEFTNSMENDHGFGDIILIPTQSLLQKWLREVHGIHIDIRTNAVSGGNYFFYLFQTKAPFYTLFVSEKNSDNYEEALEYALKESLKLIK